MRRCLLAFMLAVAAVVGLASVVRADTDPVSTWYQQVAEWRPCVRGVIAEGATIDTARTACGERPAPPADPRLGRFRQAIKDWRICIREKRAAGVRVVALREACPMPKLPDFGLPNPPESPKPAWVEPYRRAHKAWEDCRHAQREAGDTIDDARASCGSEPTPDQFGGPARPEKPKPPVTTTVAPGASERELATKAFRVCVEREMKAGASMRRAFDACRDKLPPGVEPPPIVKDPPVPRPIEPLPPVPPVTEPKPETPTTQPVADVAARFRRCLEERAQQGLTPVQGHASCVAGAPAGFVPPPAPG